MQWNVHLVEVDGSEMDVTVQADTKVNARDVVLGYYPGAALTPLVVPPPSPEPDPEDDGMTSAESRAISAA